MQIIDPTSSLQIAPCVATIGFFDGVHRGHRFLIEQVKEAADARGLRSALITFQVHPRKVMNPEFHPELLTTQDEKTALLAETGIESCIMLDFTQEMSQLSAREFMIRLKELYNVECLLIGYDHRFGHNRSEGFEDYCRYGKVIGMQILLARAYLYNNMHISSSVIRACLHKGASSDASCYLGYNYFLDGTVVSGYQIGRKIGFPTANLQVDHPDKLIPADGVYAVYVTFDGQTYKGMLNIGHRPTVNNGENRSIEVHIFQFHSDIYGKSIRLSFVERIRSEMKFGSMEELIEQLHKDASTTEALLR